MEALISKDHRIVCGDATSAVRILPDASIDLTVSSPPYFRHRDYRVEGQFGAEESVEGYIAAIRTILFELYRATASTGVCFFIVGDTYRKGRLLLVPHRIALAADEIGWTIRNDLIWSKLDAPPESPRNRWRSAHEHMLFLTRHPAKYTFNADPIRVPYSDATIRRWGNGQVYGGAKSLGRKSASDSRMRHGKSFLLNPSGCIPTDVFSMPAGDSKAAHYATFPDKLIRPLVLACSNPGDIVLDPFVGSGTTCRVAKELGRRSIGIELNPDYADMAANAIGTTVDYLSALLAATTR